MLPDFNGTFFYWMDKKGRVVLPPAFRAGLGNPFVLTRAPGQTLLAVSCPQWEALCERYAESTLFQGYYLAAAHVTPVDGITGRALVPHALREHAGFRQDTEVVQSGIGRGVQLAARPVWDQQLRTGAFPSLGQLDADLKVPSKAEAAPFKLETILLYEIPILFASGRLTDLAARQLLFELERVAGDRPPVILLDATGTGAAPEALNLALSLFTGPPVWVVAQQFVSRAADWFPRLDGVLWRLAELSARQKAAQRLVERVG